MENNMDSEFINDEFIVPDEIITYDEMSIDNPIIDYTEDAGSYEKTNNCEIVDKNNLSVTNEKHEYQEEIKDQKNCNVQVQKVQVNCNLEAGFNSKNKMIYVCPGERQYFTAEVSKCCGSSTIKYIGRHKNGVIQGKLGCYIVTDFGIVFTPKKCMRPYQEDYLYFRATDDCTNQSCEFVTIFSYTPTECCKGCHN